MDYRPTYEKVYSMANVVTVILIGITFVMKPGWCSQMEDGIRVIIFTANLQTKSSANLFPNFS
jgi:hypothetical protein